MGPAAGIGLVGKALRFVEVSNPILDHYVSFMDYLTLSLAGLSLLVAALSLGWQVAGYLLEGRRVRVTLLHGAQGHVGAAVGPVKRDRKPNNLRGLRAEGFEGTEIIGITATNIGRAPITIERYSVHAHKGGMAFTPLGDRMGPEFPFRLPPGESQSWYAEMRDARALIHALNAVKPARTGDVYMSITLGTGDQKHTKRRIQVT